MHLALAEVYVALVECCRVIYGYSVSVLVTSYYVKLAKSIITVSWLDDSNFFTPNILTKFGRGHGHIKTAEQRTIIQQYSDWYTGR